MSSQSLIGQNVSNYLDEFDIDVNTYVEQLTDSIMEEKGTVILYLDNQEVGNFDVDAVIFSSVQVVQMKGYLVDVQTGGRQPTNLLLIFYQGQLVDYEVVEEFKRKIFSMLRYFG